MKRKKEKNVHTIFSLGDQKIRNFSQTQQASIVLVSFEIIKPLYSFYLWLQNLAENAFLIKPYVQVWIGINLQSYNKAGHS